MHRCHGPAPLSVRDRLDISVITAHRPGTGIDSTQIVCEAMMRRLSRTFLLVVLWSLAISCLVASVPVRPSGTELPAAPEGGRQTLRGLEQAVEDAWHQGGRSAQAAALDQLAQHYHEQGRGPEAYATLVEALRLDLKDAEETGDIPRAAKRQRQLGGFQALRGCLYDGRTHYRAALRLYEALAMPEQQLLVLKALAAVDMQMGRYDEALQGFDAALDLMTSDTGAAKQERAKILEVKALIGFLIGRFDASRKSWEEALALYRAAGDQSAVFRASMMMRLFDTSGRMLEDVLAEPDPVKAEAALGGLFPGLSADGTERVLEQLVSEAPGVAAMFEAILSQVDQSGLSGPAMALRSALPLLQHEVTVEVALQSAADSLISGIAEVQVAAFQTLADALHEAGRPHSAIVAAKVLIERIQAMREENRGMEERLQARLLKVREAFYRALIGLLIETGRLDEAQAVIDLLREAERYAYVAGPESIDPRRGEVPFTPHEAQWRDRVQRAAVGYCGPTQGTTGAAGDAYYAARRVVAKDDLLAALRDLDLDAERWPGGNGLDASNDGQPGAGKGELVRRLTELNGAPVGFLQPVVLDRRVYLLLTTPAGTTSASVKIAEVPAFADAGEPSLNECVDALREALVDPKRDAHSPAQALYKILFAPVAEALAKAEVTTLVVAPDRKLRYIPFAALWDGEQWLVERFALVRYAPVSEQSDIAVARPYRIAALGTSGAHGEFKALPAVRTEIDAIVRDEGDAEDRGMLPGRAWIDAEFTEPALRRAASGGYQVIHIASHFDLRPGQDACSRLLLGTGETRTLEDLRLSQLDLTGVDLVALSACETAHGGTGDMGIEIEGLGTIFQRHGARSVLASLWKVGDESTAWLMRRFYQLRSEQGMNKADALRTAQLDMMRLKAGDVCAELRERGFRVVSVGSQPCDRHSERDYAHPYYWAPFILMGQWIGSPGGESH